MTKLHLYMQRFVAILQNRFCSYHNLQTKEIPVELSLEAARPKQLENVFPVLLDPSCIGVLKQVRGTFTSDGIDDLALSIKRLGQKTPGLVVALTEHQAREYLRAINRMWGVRHRLTEFTEVRVQEKSAKFYFFLVIGERRLRAVKKANVQYLADLQFGGDFLDLIQMQFHENNHEALGAEDTARFLTLFWFENHRRDKKEMTLTEFAQKFGSSPEKVRKAIRFGSLPMSLQQCISPNDNFKKGVPYGMLCELARLQEAAKEQGRPYSEIDLQHLLYTMVGMCKTVKRATAFVSERIKALRDEDELFELTPEVAVNGAKKTVSSGLESTLRTGEEHFELIARLHQTGGVDQIVSGGAVNAVRSALAVARDLAPKIIDGVRGARGASRARKELQKV